MTTRNRKDDLRVCLASVRQQNVPLEIIVIDDASSDGTAELVRTEFAEARLVVHARNQGYIRGRNEAAALATGDVIVSIDDDAAFSSPDIVSRTLTLFDDERIAAVAIPYIDVNRDRIVNQLAPDAAAPYVVSSYIGTAHAIRRTTFLELHGYREELFHQGEESDLCIRLLAAGYVVRLGLGEPIHHFESPRRDFRRMDHFGPRNAVLFAWQNVPFPRLLMQLPMTVAGLLTLTLNPSRLATRLAGIAGGLRACLRVERSPVSDSAFRLWRRLRAAGTPLRLAEIAGELEPRR